MDTLIDNLVQLMTDWGYVGLFLSSFLAGSVIPFSSELVLAAILGLGLSPFICVTVVTLGNTAGGMTCYYMGRLGRLDWIERYFGVKHEKIERMQRILSGKGALMGFFAFLPFIGSAIAIALGYMRSNIWLTTLSMLVGKLVRYVLMVLAIEGVLSIV